MSVLVWLELPGGKLELKIDGMLIRSGTALCESELFRSSLYRQLKLTQQLLFPVIYTKTLITTREQLFWGFYSRRNILLPDPVAFVF